MYFYIKMIMNSVWLLYNQYPLQLTLNDWSCATNDRKIASFYGCYVLYSVATVWPTVVALMLPLCGSDAIF